MYVVRVKRPLGRRLVLNERKSVVLSLADDDIQVSCDGTALPQGESARYLGVTVDKALSWEAHVSALVTKAGRKIGALRRARRSLSLHCRLTYLRSVIVPDLLYGAVSYATALRQGQLDRLQKLQNRAIRPRSIRTAAIHLRQAPASRRIALHYRGTVPLQAAVLRVAVLAWPCIRAPPSHVPAGPVTLPTPAVPWFASPSSPRPTGCS